MSAPRFSEGDRVRVYWMGKDREATVAAVELRHGRPHKVPLYVLTIEGFPGLLGYRENEMTPAVGVLPEGEKP